MPVRGGWSTCRAAGCNRTLQSWSVPGRYFGRVNYRAGMTGQEPKGESQ